MPLRTRCVLLVMLILTAAATGQAAGAAESAGLRFYTRMQALEGHWEGTFQWSGGRTDAGPMRATYALSSGGSALIEQLYMGRDTSPSMTSVYHIDGSDLRMTHYCMARNQPRLRATRIDESTTTAEFGTVDVTGSDPQGRPHVRGLTLRLVDANTLTIAFTFGAADSPRRDVESIVLTRARE